MAVPSKLYQLAQGSMPSNFRAMDGYRVAFLRHSVSKISATAKDFVWTCDTGDTTFESFHTRYVKSCVNDSVEAAACRLFHGRDPISIEARVRNYDFYNERLVVVEVRRPTDVEQQMLSPTKIPGSRHRVESEPDSYPPPSGCSNSRYEPAKGRVSVKSEASQTDANDLQMVPLKEGHNRLGTSRQEGPIEKEGTSLQPLFENMSVGNSLEDIVKNFQASVDNSDLEGMEAAVGSCNDLLRELRSVFVRPRDPCLELRLWIEQIDAVVASFHIPKTVIGIVGQTGAGKSSLVNALLDEEQIVPTSYMQACTAVPTQIAYNHETESRYRAEIEFIAQAEWKRELDIFLDEMETDIGESPEKSDCSPTDISTSAARVSTVYPQIQNKHATKRDVPELLDLVKHLLGNIAKIEDNDATRFNESVQKYVFNREQEIRESESDEQIMGLWPLVKIVRIYIKNPTLATGAVLMDLPGLGDSNAARSIVAQRYMADCNAIWVVSAIKRAVDDEIAKELLGESLNLQLKMDGALKATSIICTSSDEISLTEAPRTLGKSSIVKAMRQERDECQRKVYSLNARIKRLECDIATILVAGKADEDEISELEKKLSVQFGDSLSEPQVNPRKRKASPDLAGSVKKRQGSDLSQVVRDDTAEGIDSSFIRAASLAGQNAASVDNKPPDSLECNIDKLRSKKDQDLLKIPEMQTSLDQKKNQKERLQKTVLSLKHQIAAIYIDERNRFCKQKIRAGFVACIHQVGDMKSQQKDPRNLDPDAEFRDDRAMADCLKVFCVSSRAYQQLQGRYVEDADILGFDRVDDTEIPAMRNHCVQLTEAPRMASCKRFLISLAHLANSMILWAFEHENGRDTVSNSTLRRDSKVNASLEELKSSMLELIKETINELRSGLDRHIYAKLPEAAKLARNASEETVTQWGSGVRWNTYKATCRREGVWKGRDWNRELLNPITRRIASDWEAMFNNTVPAVLESLKENVNVRMKKFYRDTTAAIDESPISQGSSSLQSQFSNYEKILRDLCESTNKSIRHSQKKINRKFKPVIAMAMEKGYSKCAREKGQGSFQRMKEGMTSHMSEVQASMFTDSCDAVLEQLKGLIGETEARMLDEVKKNLTSLRRDYKTAIGIFNRNEDEATQKTRCEVASQVLGVLSQLGRIEFRMAHVASEEGQRSEDDESWKGLGDSE